MKKNILLAPDSAGGAATLAPGPSSITETDAERMARLQAENEEMRKRLAQIDADKEREEADEKIIKEKMDRGLTRPQAIAVIRRQREHDAATEREWRERRPRVIELLKQYHCTAGNVPMKCRVALRNLFPYITLDEIQAAQAEIAGKKEAGAPTA